MTVENTTVTIRTVDGVHLTGTQVSLLGTSCERLAKHG